MELGIGTNSIQHRDRIQLGISGALPLTYANRAFRNIMLRGASLTDVSTEIGVLVLFAIGMLTAAVITVRKA